MYETFKELKVYLSKKSTTTTKEQCSGELRLGIGSIKQNFLPALLIQPEETESCMSIISN